MSRQGKTSKKHDSRPTSSQDKKTNITGKHTIKPSGQIKTKSEMGNYSKPPVIYIYQDSHDPNHQIIKRLESKKML